MSQSTRTSSVKDWLRTILPLFVGMISGHLAFNLHHWISKETQLPCFAYNETNISSTVSEEEVGNSANKATANSIVSTSKKPRILCYINTYPPNYETKAIHAQSTWARRCDGFYFTSTVRHPKLSVLVVNMTQPEVRSHLWVKMRKILREIYHFIDDYDYFFKADDDTYAFVPNMKEFLDQNGDPQEPTMWGYRWNVRCPGGYFSGGSGYILTREALKRIVERAIDRHPVCPTTDENMEDVKMCLCGRAVGIRLKDAYDKKGTNLFYPYNLLAYAMEMVNAKRTTLLKHDNSSIAALKRFNLNFSPSHISFHYVLHNEMYIFEFLAYYLRPIGFVL